MATFVLVHGSWVGGWIWSKIRSGLEAAGHRVLAPSLTGLGDRHHLAGPDVGLDVHVRDIANLIEWEDLDDVVLVGHSYGGMVITGVAAVVPDRIAQVVYVDAFAPRTAQAAFDLLPQLREQFEASDDGSGWAVSPPDFGLLGITDEADLRRLTAKATALPTLTHTQPLGPGSEEVLKEVAVTYIQGAAETLFDETAADCARRGFRLVTWPDANHALLVTHPDRLVTELLSVTSAPASR